jgi:polysaccharide export outer membrane protein
MRFVLQPLVLCGALLAAAAGSAQDLRLAPGDVLTIQVARLPELDRNAMIGLDGTIRVGGASVFLDGLDLDGAHRAVVAALTRETGVEPSFVLVDVAEWRPVAVYGAGVRGGELPWRPGMTVRRALAAVNTRQRDEDAPQLLEIFEVQRAGTRILDEANRLARALVRIAIFEAELGVKTADAGSGDIGSANIPETSAVSAAMDRFRAIETEVHSLRRARTQQQQENLAAQRTLIADQIESLTEELALQRRRVALSEEQLATTEQLSARGLSTQDRVSNRQTDLMNAQLLLIRILSERAAAETRLALIDSAVAELATSWTLELTNELKDARNEAITARNALTLAHHDLAAGEEVVGGIGVDRLNHGYAIHRNVGAEVEALAAGPDTTVLPGDVIEVIRK